MSAAPPWAVTASVDLPTVAPLAQIAGELLWVSDDLTASSPWQFGGAGTLLNLDDFHDDLRFTGVDGTGFSVAVLDTGIDLDHPFFGPDLDGDGVADRIVYNQDFVGGDPDAQDGHGHGSNVSSIIASSSPTYPGVAPGVDIIHLQVLNDNGSGTFAGIEQALQWVAANAGTYNIAAVNMSLGDGGNYAGPVSRYGLSDEMAALAAMDVAVVSAAGNSFYSFDSVPGVAYPAADPSSLAVGAVYADGESGWYYGSGAKAFTTAPDRIAPFSQRHTLLTEVFAPGAPIVGASATGGLTVMHGTSQAAPQVAGATVLAQQLAERELGRRLSVAELRQLLAAHSVSVHDGDDEDDNVTNTGADYLRLDMLALAEGIVALNALPFEDGSEARYVDAVGIWVTVSLSGPGQGSVVLNPGGGGAARVEVDGTTAETRLVITPDGQGTTTALDELVVAGSLKGVVAERVDLEGQLTIGGGVDHVALADVHGAQITIGYEHDNALHSALSFRRVADLSIDSAVALRSVTAVEWQDHDGTADVISAPALGQLAVRGSRLLGVAGDFAAGLSLAGTAQAAPPGVGDACALGYVQIAGRLTEADWEVAGDIGRIDAGAVSGWSLTAEGDVRTLRLGQADDVHLSVDGCIESIFAARWSDSSINADQIEQSRLVADAPGLSGAAAATLIAGQPQRLRVVTPAAADLSIALEAPSTHQPAATAFAAMIQRERALQRAAASVDGAVAAWSAARASLEQAPILHDSTHLDSADHLIGGYLHDAQSDGDSLNAATDTSRLPAV